MSAMPLSGRIGALPALPVFFKLQGRTVLLAGGAEPAVWKAELLAAAGAQVLVCDPEPCAAMVGVAQASTGAITLEHRRWRAADLTGAALAIGAIDDEAATEFRDAARLAGVPVNIVDRPTLCDFQFGTIIDRSPMLIAISTDGAAPVFGQALRTRIEALLPAQMSAWAKAARAWRPSVQALDLGFAARRRFWERFSARAFDPAAGPPDEADRLAFLEDARATDRRTIGRLECVGLGSGDPAQLTLAAVAALQSADVIIVGTDTDAAQTLLGRREAERRSEPDGDQLLSVVEDEIDAGRNVLIAGLGDPRRCDRWLERNSVLSVASYRTVDGMSCPTCHPACAARAFSARA